MKLAEIRDINFTVNTNTAKTEAELAYVVLSMDLVPDAADLLAPRGFAIAVKSSTAETKNSPLFVRDMSIATLDTNENTDDESAPLDEKEFPPVEVPRNKFLIANLARLRTSNGGLLVTLDGWNEVIKDQSADGLTKITELASTEITKANLPVRIGLIALDKLLNIQPVVFKPAGQV